MDNTAENSGTGNSLPLQTPLRGFWMLTITQFQGAFSDNALRWLIGFLILEAGLSRERRDLFFVLVVPLLFAVPFLLFSIPGGYFADRYSKRTITVNTKFLELGIMSYAAWALAGGRLVYAGAALFLVCSQAAIFGPTKYGLLPELLPLQRLSWGNGIIELTTFLAAILGTLAGGLLAHHFAGRQFYSGLVLMGLSIAGITSSLAIPPLPIADPYREFSWNWVGNLLRVIRTMARDRFLITAVTANTFFWFLASLLLLNIVLYSTDVLHAGEVRTSYLMAALSLGIGVGSFAAGYAAREKIAHGMILPSMLAICLLCALLAWPGLSFLAMLWLLVALGVSAGFFAVPVNALIQARPAREEKGRMIAAANLLSFVGIAMQPVAQYGMLRLGHPEPGHVFVIAAAITVAMAAVLWKMLPELWK